MSLCRCCEPIDRRLVVTRYFDGGKRSAFANFGQAGQAFDLNVEKVLEHWSVPFAIRELIANALDEQALTGTGEPAIFKDAGGRWHIADAGRGIRYEHLTQNENAEKRTHPQVIGQFGMGLKDALAVFDRRGVGVAINSPHAVITTGRRPKEGFPDVITLHALVSAQSSRRREGRDPAAGVTDADIETARRFFLRYSGERLLESTEYGDVLARSEAEPASPRLRQGPARRGGTELPVLLQHHQAVGRTAAGAEPGAQQRRPHRLLRPGQGHPHSLQVHAGRRPARRGPERLLAGTAARRARLARCRPARLPGAADQRERHLRHRLADGEDTAQIRYAQADGYRIVVVPEDIARSLGGLTDLDGNPMVDLDRYRDDWNESFSFTFVEPATMTASERAVFARTRRDRRARSHRPVQAEQSPSWSPRRCGSTTRAPGPRRLGTAERRIVIRRDQLAIANYAGTLLHEIGHMTSGTRRNSGIRTGDFEDCSAGWQQQSCKPERQLTPLVGRV